jgi:mRNA interferase YafQ
MYSISFTNRFRKDVKRCKKRGYDLTILQNAIDILQISGKLPSEYKPHKLSGDYEGFWECHLKPNWLMVWEQDDNLLTLLFMTTGTHSDLF